MNRWDYKRRDLSAIWRLSRRLSYRDRLHLSALWPVADALFGLVFFRDGQAAFMTTAAAAALDRSGRLDIDSFGTPDEMIVAHADLFGGDGYPSHARRGRWGVLYLGERDEPLPQIVPLEDEIMDMKPHNWQSLRAFARAIWPSHTKLLFTNEDGPIETCYEFSEVLGYNMKDHSWVPQQWSIQAPYGAWMQYVELPTGDGLKAPVRVISVRSSENLTAYWLRYYPGAQCPQPVVELALVDCSGGAMSA